MINPQHNLIQSASDSFSTFCTTDTEVSGKISALSEISTLF